MKRLICFFALTLSLVVGSLLLVSPSTSAITFGFVDSSNTFKNIGAFIVKSPTTGEIFPICSGTMITANVFLTAGHCTAFYTQDLAPEGFVAFVSLDQSIPFGSLTTNKTELLPVAHVVTNPNFNQAQSDSGDIGVLILERNVRGVTPATLPACGLLDQLGSTKRIENCDVYECRIWITESRGWRWRAVLPGFESDTTHVLFLELQLAEWRLSAFVTECFDWKWWNVLWRFGWTKLPNS